MLPEMENWLAIATGHYQAGELSPCIAQCQRILHAQPACLPALELLSRCYLQLADFQPAVECLTLLAEHLPARADIHCNLGTAKQYLGLPHEAIAHFLTAIDLAPALSDAHFNLGNAYRLLEHHELADQCYLRALELAPTHVSAWSNRGLLAFQRGDFTLAKLCYEQALQIDPQSAAAHNGLGTVCQQLAQHEAAIAHYQAAIRLQPRFAEAHNNLGMAWLVTRQLPQAQAAFEEALRIDPAMSEAHVNLGNIARAAGDPQTAITHFQRALELRPDVADTHHGIGVACHDLGEFAEAEASFRAAIACAPDCAAAHSSLATQQLLLGDFAAGLARYEWRWKTGQLPPRNFAQPVWNGEPLAGQTILLHAEQGFGDTLQFIRYAALVQQRGGLVLLEAQPELIHLVRTAPGVDRVIARGDPLPPFAVHAPLLSLPRIFHTDLATVPAAVPYLQADSQRIVHWQEVLAAWPGYRIGLNWRGREGSFDAAKRNLPLAGLCALAALPGVQLISLQQGPTEAEMSVCGDALHFLADLDAELPFADTAALLSLLDLAITSDTSIAHLAGALARPVWVALPQIPDWRWLLNRSDSPWYPTMRLFRQQQRGDWSSVLAKMHAELQAIAAPH